MSFVITFYVPTLISLKFHEWGSDSSVAEYSGLVQCDTVLLGEWSQTFKRMYRLLQWSLRCTLKISAQVHHFPVECQEPHIQWHGATSQQPWFPTNSVVNIFRLYRVSQEEGQNFGRVFLMLNYTDITQNTYIQSWTVTEIMAREKCWHLAFSRTVRLQLLRIDLDRAMQ